MEDWCQKAAALFPELEDEITEPMNGPTGFWNELYFALESAYQSTPINEDLIRRIYEFAAWCFQQPDTGSAETDLSSAAAVGLIESLPLDKNVSADLYRWLSVEAFEGFKALFLYHLSEEEYRQLHADFMRKKKDYSGSSVLH